MGDSKSRIDAEELGCCGIVVAINEVEESGVWVYAVTRRVTAARNNTSDIAAFAARSWRTHDFGFAPNLMARTKFSGKRALQERYARFALLTNHPAAPNKSIANRMCETSLLIFQQHGLEPAASLKP